MSEKRLPCSEDFLRQVCKDFGTPFHIYDEAAIRENVRNLFKAFNWAPKFIEYFAVKALPNPHILQILASEGCGADCSSLAELLLAEAVGIKGEKICFTSNDTPIAEYKKALDLGAVINLDDISHVEYLKEHDCMPEMICCRYNPGPMRSGGNDIIGYPEEAKYGMTAEQIVAAFRACSEQGVKRFGIHTMIVSNELNADYFVETAQMMFDLAVSIKRELGIAVEIVNFGGGLGIPYRPEHAAIDLAALGSKIETAYQRTMVPAGLADVTIALESGRMITGPYGWLVAQVLHKKDIYKKYVGLDTCMTDLMRPALYGAYHHITVLGKQDLPHDYLYDVTGSLCENNDKFAIDRQLPQIDIGDIVVIHDTGAHGSAMGFNYNGKLRCKELLLQSDGSIKQIRRAETVADYFATLDYPGLAK